MKAKYLFAFLVVSCCLFWLATMVIPYFETLTTPNARAAFLVNEFKRKYQHLQINVGMALEDFTQGE